MNKQRLTISIIIAAITLIAAIGLAVCKLIEKTDLTDISRITIDPDDIESVIIIYQTSGKEITRTDDIKSVCNIFNSMDMEIAYEWDDEYDMYDAYFSQMKKFNPGGICFTFYFHHFSGKVVKLSYGNGFILTENPKKGMEGEKNLLEYKIPFNSISQDSSWDELIEFAYWEENMLEFWENLDYARRVWFYSDEHLGDELPTPKNAS